MTSALTDGQLACLQRYDTCTLSNAIETFGVRMRNEGYTDASIRCLTGCSSPMTGYAATLRLRSADPRKDGHAYVDHTEWWNWLRQKPGPHVVVIEDVDHRPGSGSFIGEVHAAILAALGCVGVVTNGAVRDLPALSKAGFHAFAAGTTVSHAYSHIVEVGPPVTLGGLEIRTGDLLHADVHGLLSVPLEIASRLPAAAEDILVRERKVLELCRSAEFSIELLRDAVKGIFH